MSLHRLQLASEPFQAILAGRKTIESRLYDEKRKAIKVGDSLEFSNRLNPTQTVTTLVTDILRYDSFPEMFASHDPSEFGNPDKAELLQQISKFYTLVDQRKFGVVGIKFRIS